MTQTPQPRAAPAEAGLDETASFVAYGILLAAIAEHGVTRKALAAAVITVAATDAIERDDARGRTVRDS